ncbi:MAG: DNA polymerase III subunit [Thermoanaerobaculia bacterium]
MDAVTLLLLDTARRGELAHAVILHGPDSDALRDLSLRIARVLNCASGSGEDGCTNCDKIARGIHPDVHVTAVADDRKMISVEQIRTIVEQASLRPYEARTKVFIVESADAMSVAGANALLKTLEEPAPDTAFLLLTRSADRLLPTIRSRSQSIAIRPSGNGDSTSASFARRVRGAAIAAGVDETVAADLADAALERLRDWASGDDTPALLEIGAIAGSADDPAAAMAILAFVMKDLAVEREGETDAARVVRERAGTGALLRAAEGLLRASMRLNVNIDARLAIEQALIELTKN